MCVHVHLNLYPGLFFVLEPPHSSLLRRIVRHWRWERDDRTTQDVTRASSSDDVGGDVAMREDSADEKSAGHPSSSGSDSRRRITTKREPREVRHEQPSTSEQQVPRRISVKTTPSEHAVTTQEALGGYRDKAMRIENVENNALNWVSISSAGALDMTHCDFSARSARDAMRQSRMQ